MANVNIRYPEYPNTAPFEADGKTVVPAYVSSHPHMNKCNITFNTYSGVSGDSLKRVGNLFKVNEQVYAEFVIGKTKYVMHVNTGKVEESIYFNERIKTM